MVDTFAFSVRGCLGVMESYEFSDGDMIKVMKGLKAADKIRSDGYVIQTDLDAAIRAHREEGK